MSHMGPVSGTDMDLFIAGIIPVSPHLRPKRIPQKPKTQVYTWSADALIASL